MTVSRPGRIANNQLAEAGNPRSFRCHLAVLREDDGTFSAIVMNLPGAGSCGESEGEAIANAREAIAGVIESYLASSEAIPWRSEAQYIIPDGARQEWILVDV